MKSIFCCMSSTKKAIKLSKNQPLGRFFHREAMSVCLSVCPLPMQFFSRPLIGPQITWSDPGLSLVEASKKIASGGDKQTNIHTNRQTLFLYERIGQGVDSLKIVWLFWCWTCNKILTSCGSLVKKKFQLLTLWLIKRWHYYWVWMVSNCILWSPTEKICLHWAKCG